MTADPAETPIPSRVDSPGAAMPGLEPEATTHQVLIVRLADRPGALTAVASVFSSRGISLRTTVAGTVMPPPAPRPINNLSPLATVTVVVSFMATASQAAMLARVVRRLGRVVDVHPMPYDCPALRAAIMVRTAAAPTAPPLIHGPAGSVLAFADGAVRAEVFSWDPPSHTALLSGPAFAVDTVIADLVARGELREMVCALLAI